MLAAIAKKAATPATVLNPVRYWTLTHAAADSIAVGEDTILFETARWRWPCGRSPTTRGYPDRAGFEHRGRAPRPARRCCGTTAKAKEMFAEIARGDTSELDKYAK